MRIAAAVVAAVCLAAPAAAQTADVVGVWDLVFNTQRGETPAQLTLKKDGEKMSGTITSQIGEAAVTAEVKDKTLTIWFTFRDQNGSSQIAMTGTIDGGALKGTLTADGTPAGDWTGRRPAKADLSGTWNVTIQTDNFTATPTLVLKQDGDKLTGEYTSQMYGKFPVTGTVKGADVNITFPMNVEGNAITVVYAGKVDKDQITGSANYGDMLSGTFTAARKK
jgi:hypothetical protein